MTQYTAGVIVKEVQPGPRPRYHFYILGIVGTLLLLLPVAYFAQHFSAYLTIDGIAADRNMADTADVQLASSIDSFTVSAYKALSLEDEGSGNLFFSPLSVMTALGMTLMGARSNTRDQLASVLGLQHSDQAVAAAFGTIVEKYQAVVPEYELRTANLMYSSHVLQMQQEFADVITGPFQAKAKGVDFGGQTEAVRQEINQEVEGLTNSKIKDLIPQGILNSMTRLVLVNAVYFKGLWTKPFGKERTDSQPFYTTATTQVQVPMMRMTSEFLLQRRPDLGAQVLAMDYKGSNLSLVLVLPDAMDGLSAVEEKLSGVELSKLAAGGKRIKTHLSLPRFKLEYSKDLVKTIAGLGAPDLFTAGVSDLSGIGGRPGDLYISNILHKAFLEVNEEGTEAAAATAMIAMTRAMIMPPTPSFKADHPFAFFLQDRDLKLTLFAGRYTTPDAAAREEL